MGIETALIGGSLLSGGLGLFGAKTAADAQADAAAQAQATELAMFKQNRADLEPWRNAGQQSLAAYLYELGIGPRPERYSPGNLAITDAEGNRVGEMDKRNPTGVYKVGDKTFNTLAAAKSFAFDERNKRDLSYNYKGFETTPGYEFQRDEGQKQIDRAMAARGLFFSGPAQKETARFQTGLLNQEYNNYLTRLAQASNMGQGTANTLAGLGANTANNVGQYQLAAGQARASGYENMFSGINQTIGNLGQTYMLGQMGAFKPFGTA